MQYLIFSFLFSPRSSDSLTPLRGQSRGDDLSCRIRSRENSRNVHTPVGSRENSVNRQSVLHSRENSHDASMYANRENDLRQDSNKMMAPSSGKHMPPVDRSNNQAVKTPITKEPVTQMSEEEIEKKMTAIIDEYLNIKDLRVRISFFSLFLSLYLFLVGEGG